MVSFLNKGIIFQSTLPREERRICVSYFCNIDVFQSTLPREERHLQGNRLVSRLTISIHAPTRGATDDMAIYHCSVKFQSTLPREERLIDDDLSSDDDISIHAPTRGATNKATLIRTV